LQGIYIYTSTNGTTWSSTPGNDLYVATADGNYREGKCIVQRPDGKWLLYYQQHSGASTQRRQVGVYLSNTTSPTGAYTDLGVVIDSQAQTEQRYAFFVTTLGDLYISKLSDFNKTTERIKTQLAVSRDGITWRVIDKTWLDVGSATAWDDEQVWSMPGFLEVSNEWWHYYIGSAENHAAFPRSSKLGLAKIGKGRLCSMGTTGAVRLKSRAITSGQTIVLNVNATGSAKVELWDSNNAVISGYSRGLCDTITGDTYATTVTWSGSSVLPNATAKIVIVLDNATLYSLAV
jgi:hypothetical protein